MISVEAVIYDLDGTLLDTEDLSTRAIINVVGEYGKTYTWENKKKILGTAGSLWTKIVLQDMELEGILEPNLLFKRWQEFCEKEYPNCVLLSGAEWVTAYLHTAGVRQAIGTSSSQHCVDIKRSTKEHIFSKMEVIVCGDDPSVKHGKPAPDIYRVTAERLNVNPAKCIVFEDAITGVKAAKAAGMFVIAVPDPRLDISLFAEADMILKSIEEFDPTKFQFVAKPNIL